MPDIDMDFEDARRGEVIQYVRERYGESSVAQVATFGRMEAKQAVRDVGRALGMLPKETDMISKLIPFGTGLQDSLDAVEKLKTMYDDGTKLSGTTVKELFDTAMKLESVNRNFSTHAAGVVIADTELTNYLPLQRDKDGNVITQWDHNLVEAFGLLKMDFLGLSYLGVIQNTVNMVKDQLGVMVDISHVDTEEPAVYKLISSGDTIGVFQMESGGMKGVAAGVQPTSIEDLTAIISLYRPGTIKAGGIQKYIDRKNGKEKAVYYHPSIEGVLKPTYGIIVYQNIMQIATHAGFTIKKRTSAQGVSRRKRTCWPSRGPPSSRIDRESVPKKTADDVFALIDFFAGYGFNKSHGSPRHHGLPHGVAKAHYLIQTSRLMNSGIDSKTVSKSWSPNAEARISPFFRQISTDPKSCSPSRHSPTARRASASACLPSRIWDQRQSTRSWRNGPTAPIRHSRTSSGVPAAVRSTASPWSVSSKPGVRDPGLDRVAVLREFNSQNGKVPLATDPGSGLFGGSVSENTAPASLCDTAGAAAMEKEAFGFFCFCSPFQQYESLLTKYKAKRVSECTDLEDGTTVTVMGLLTSAKTAKSKAGHAYGKCTLEDDSRKVELMVFEYVLGQFQPCFDREGAIVLEANVRMDGDELSLTARKFIDFVTPEQAKGSKPVAMAPLVLKLTLTEQQVNGETLKNVLLLTHHYPGKEHWRILYRNGSNHCLEVGNQHWVTVTPALLKGLAEILGPGGVDYS